MSAPPPEPVVVLFDGVCNLCDGAVRFLIARDPAGRLRFAALQSDAARRLLEPRGVDPAELSSLIVVADERVLRESDAALAACARLRAPWRWLAWLRVVPRVLRDPLYRFVAARRYRWFGRRDACALPTPELSARFLD